MSKLAGYVIVAGEHPDVKVFAEYRLGSEGPEPRWSDVEVGAYTGKWAIYKDHVEAEQIRLDLPKPTKPIEGKAAYSVLSTKVEPIWIGSSTPPNLFGEINEELEKQESSIFNLLSDNDEWVSEFWDTGSVTVTIQGTPYVLSINVRPA